MSITPKDVWPRLPKEIQKQVIKDLTLAIEEIIYENIGIDLKRKAIIYIRQSTPQQAIKNKESLDLQYSLRQRATELGWQEDSIEIVDDDLGITGSSIQFREGFKNILAEVTLEKIGIILSYDVTRLSRNCTDWYQLLDLCAFKNCLIADRESIYNPSNVNGRMLLGF